MHILHKWRQWSRLVDCYSGDKRQFRACEVCGVIRSRSIGYADGVAAGAANSALELTSQPHPEKQGDEK